MRFLSAVEVVPLGSVELPTERRLFHAGENPTANGPVVLDQESADRVVAAFKAQGVRLMIDLNHDSLHPATSDARADAKDAMGWADLEVRPGPELWLTNILWSAEGSRRVTARLQNYFSPAVVLDEQDRPVEIVNVALCAMPATVNAPALLSRRAVLGKSACNKRKRLERTNMNVDLVKQALDALAAQDLTACADLLKQCIAAAASGEDPGESPPTTDPAAGAPELAATLARFTADMAAFRAERAAFTEEIRKFSAERASAEHAQRVALIGRLVAVGAETPATAWEAEGKPVARLAAEPLATLSVRVEALEAARPAGPALRPPSPTTRKLTATDQAARARMTPEQQAKFDRLVAVGRAQ